MEYILGLATYPYCFTDKTGRQWGAHATTGGPQAMAIDDKVPPPDPHPLQPEMHFLCEDGEQRSVVLEYFRDVDNCTSVELIAMWQDARP